MRQHDDSYEDYDFFKSNVDPTQDAFLDQLKESALENGFLNGTFIFADPYIPTQKQLQEEYEEEQRLAHEFYMKGPGLRNKKKLEAFFAREDVKRFVKILSAQIGDTDRAKLLLKTRVTVALNILGTVVVYVLNSYSHHAKTDVIFYKIKAYNLHIRWYRDGNWDITVKERYSTKKNKQKATIKNDKSQKIMINGHEFISLDSIITPPRLE